MLNIKIHDGKGRFFENVIMHFEKDEIPENILDVLLSSVNLCYSENPIGLDKTGKTFTFFDNIGFVAKDGKLSEPKINRWAINDNFVNFEVCRWLNCIANVYSTLFFHWRVRDVNDKTIYPMPDGRDYKQFDDIEVKSTFVEKVGLRLQYNDNGDFSCLEVMFEMRIHQAKIENNEND